MPSATHATSSDWEKKCRDLEAAEARIEQLKQRNSVLELENRQIREQRQKNPLLAHIDENAGHGDAKPTSSVASLQCCLLPLVVQLSANHPNALLPVHVSSVSAIHTYCSDFLTEFFFIPNWQC
ncbi:hypothetical protein GPALN_011967 [Globodera pallida]|nr:hypothetical protein GPALN_011967 [Globodera pallida]